MSPTPQQSVIDGQLDKFARIQAEAAGLFRAKNADYGNAFATYGPVGVLVRIGDKLARAVSISRSGVTLVEDEALRDTLLDLANYAMMAVMLLDLPEQPPHPGEQPQHEHDPEDEPAPEPH